jgi:hypothetical protein
MRFGAVQRVGLLLIYLIETQPGNIDRPRLPAVVKGGRIEFFRRLFMSRSRGKSLDSFYNRVYRLSCTLETIPPRSRFLVVSRQSRPAGSLHVMHPPTGCLVGFSVFQPFISLDDLNGVVVGYSILTATPKVPASNSE